MLSKVILPIFMAVLFYAVFTPVGLVMRLTGLDPLGLRLERGTASYWLSRNGRGKRGISMTRQF
jgi:hypothetical protein